MCEELKRKIYYTCANHGVRVSREYIREISGLTKVKEIYTDWESNDMGEDYSLYTGTEPGDDKESYFVFHHTRFSFGGWSWDDTFDWYKITKDAYERLCSIEPYINN